MIELITSVGYSLVEATWHASAVFIKFYLGFTALKLYDTDKLDLESFRNTMINESKTVIPVIVILGALTVAAGYELRPNFELLSEVTALFYLGYLFWEF